MTDFNWPHFRGQIRLNVWGDGASIPRPPSGDSVSMDAHDMAALADLVQDVWMYNQSCAETLLGNLLDEHYIFGSLVVAGLMEGRFKDPELIRYFTEVHERSQSSRQA